VSVFSPEGDRRFLRNVGSIFIHRRGAVLKTVADSDDRENLIFLALFTIHLTRKCSFSNLYVEVFIPLFYSVHQCRHDSVFVCWLHIYLLGRAEV
jgi:hypothetical protein